MDDRIRSLALAAATGAFVATPTLGAVFGAGEQTRRYDTVITPPAYAFWVWAPIFAGAAASTVAQCRATGRGDPVSRRAGWPLAAAYAANTAWSVAAQSDRFRYTPYLLPLATACAATAHIRLQDAGPARGALALTPASTGLLLGWTALASTVNIAAVTVPGKPSHGTVAACAAGLLAASTALATGVAASRRGALPFALAAGWGLLTTALTGSRPRPVRLAAALGATTVALAAAHASTLSGTGTGTGTRRLRHLDARRRRHLDRDARRRSRTP
ncbi:MULTISPECIES: hypothetical protein [Catenuloplanes]|uniref:Tryptophan-rich sensory protein n=1 Tax=Catenuloplanes niger TaxID=587534 RepID=A0AAE4A0C7_9ACTN|nr:hypothetical protein [Catenuloplanes niger]MDR7328131.1 hypothetical protein [Catenuloplanes niger]